MKNMKSMIFLQTVVFFGSYEFHLAGKMISVKIYDFYFKYIYIYIYIYFFLSLQEFEVFEN